jgi:co-chaperonin GroES (HSP10)
MAFAEMQHELEPRLKLLKELGDLSGIELFHNQLLVAVYLRPGKTKSGILLAEQTLSEDRFQSKLGLVVKKGPQAFISGGEWQFPDIELHDWILFRPSDGWNITINGVLCRILTDTAVKGRISSPDLIW